MLRVLTVVVCAALCASAAEAQGNRGVPPGQLRKPGPSDTPSSPAPLSIRSFGVWLDDATLALPGSVWITAALTRWTAPTSSGLDVPALSAAAGLTGRAQLSLSVPYSRFTSPSPGGVTTSGIGSIYAGVKLLARDPVTRALGVSIAPTIEILSGATAAASGVRRTHWVLPLSFETGRGSGRFYGSIGYFSRGATFAGAAVEARLPSRVALTGALLQSWSTSDAADAEALGLSRRRTDVSGGVTVFVAPNAAAFASLGRTLSPLEFDSARVVLTVGFAVGLTPSNRTPPRPPR